MSTPLSLGQVYYQALHWFELPSVSPLHLCLDDNGVVALSMVACAGSTGSCWLPAPRPGGACTMRGAMHTRGGRGDLQAHISYKLSCSVADCKPFLLLWAHCQTLGNVAWVLTCKGRKLHIGRATADISTHTHWLHSHLLLHSMQCLQRKKGNPSLFYLFH